jgi:Flp pilus assembly protein TadD
LRAAIRLDPGFNRARYELALALGRTGQREQAIATIQDLLHRDPKDVDGWNALAFLWKQSGDLPKCKDALEQGLRIDPRNAVLLENLGDVLTGEGDTVRARSTFEDLVRLHPQNASYRQKLDRLRGREGRPN